MRTEPPPSLPCERAERPATCPAAAPPLEPPGVRVVSQGLRHGGPSRFSVEPLWPISGVLVLPRMIAPDARIRSVTMSSASGTLSLKMRDPLVVRMPLVAFRSLMDMGMPCRGARRSRRITVASASSAHPIAMSPTTVR